MMQPGLNARKFLEKAHGAAEFVSIYFTVFSASRTPATAWDMDMWETKLLTPCAQAKDIAVKQDHSTLLALATHAEFFTTKAVETIRAGPDLEFYFQRIKICALCLSYLWHNIADTYSLAATLPCPRCDEGDEVSRATYLREKAAWLDFGPWRSAEEIESYIDQCVSGAVIVTPSSPVDGEGPFGAHTQLPRLVVSPDAIPNLDAALRKQDFPPTVER